MKTSEVHNTYNISETARRLKDLRTLRKLKQGDVAFRLGITGKSLGAIEHGRKGCSVDTFIGMSEIYGVSLDYLILGKDTDGKALQEKLDDMISELQRFRDAL